MRTKPLLYSYIRFSTLEQSKGQSLNRQMNYAREVAKEKGLELDESLNLQDLGMSAFDRTNITRGALGLFLEAVEQGKVPAGSILVIESLDRISRAAPFESQGIISKIINANITVITASDRKEYNKQSIQANSMDLVYIVLVLIRANEESETKSKRVRAALTKQCREWLDGKRGFRIKCGKAPKWVQWNEATKTFIFDPREQAIMLRKVELFRKGLGGLKIAEVLNNEFGAGTVHHTAANVYKEVKRRTLVGELNVTVGGTDYVLENYYPPLLSDAEFDLLIGNSKSRGAIKHSQKFVGILSGIDVFKCANCGKSVGSHVIYRGKSLKEVSGSHKRYGCVEARRNNNCEMKSTVQIDIVESAVALFCQDKVNLNRILLKGSDRDTIHEEEQRLKARLEKIEQDTESLMQTLMILTDEPPQAIANKIKMLEGESNLIQEKLIENKNKLTKIDNTFRDEVTDRWMAITDNLSQLENEKRLEIRQLVKDTFKTVTLQVDRKEERESIGVEKLIDSHFMGKRSKNCFDLTLEFHNQKKRLLRLDKKTGELVVGFDLN